jgi:hypothetical protein
LLQNVYKIVDLNKTRMIKIWSKSILKAWI